MAKTSAWDTELYEAQHAFVWKMGEALLQTLNPQPGERILDLGCGTGHLTSSIAESGASVLGLDASPDMIGQARQNYPRLPFVLQDAASMQFAGEFDAIFSNAALHWMLNPSSVAANMARALRPGGRLVVELGGKGNIAQIETAIRSVVSHYQPNVTLASRHYFPSLAQYAHLLEGQGFEVNSAALFDRPTPLTGERGMEQWIRQFAFYYFESLNSREQGQAMCEVTEELRPRLWTSDHWIADYRRLRITATVTG